MILLKQRILLVVKACQSIHYDDLTAAFGYGANEAIHSLYMGDLVGLKNNGAVFFKL